MIKLEKENMPKIHFQHIEDSELDKILEKNKNLFITKGVKLKPVPLIGIAN